MTNRVKVGAGKTVPVETKAYSAMLYALADEMRREEGCVTESPELVEQAATRLDEQTVTINELRRQHGVLLDALEQIAAETTIDGTERDDLCAIIQGICRKAIAKATGSAA